MAGPRPCSSLWRCCGWSGWIGAWARWDSCPVRRGLPWLSGWDSTRVLVLDGQHLNFGFELLSNDETDQPTALAERLDDLLVACRRRARILVGHDLAPDLARLSTFAAERRLPGVSAVRQQWSHRATKGRGMARMFDTAHDLGLPAAAELRAVCEHAALKAAAIADPGGATPAETARQAITRTLAIALVAARATGKYDWTVSLDLDQLVTDAAWDHLTQLGDDSPEDTAP